MTRPLQRVSQASDQLAQGQLNQQVEPSRITEILTLGNSFNTMAKQLKNSFTILERKNEELRIAE
jgi:nitrate/nitrite-specific signal transduction histidine kinase